MSEEVSNITAVKTASDGSVKIAVEKYNEMVEKIADQKISINSLQSRLSKALNEPPVINRTTVIKTSEMVAGDHLVWGYTFIGLGSVLLVVGAYRARAGRRINSA